MTKINLSYVEFRESKSIAYYDSTDTDSYATDDIGSFAAGSDVEALKFFRARYAANLCELTSFDGRTLMFDLIDPVTEASERVTVVFEIAED